MENSDVFKCNNLVDVAIRELESYKNTKNTMFLHSALAALRDAVYHSISAKRVTNADNIL